MDLLTDDGRAYMRERGVQHIYQDRSVLELAAMKDAYEQGMLEKFLEGGTGLMLAGPDAYDATLLMARWHILEKSETMVTSTQELAQRRADFYHTEEAYRSILNEADLVCLTDFQNDGESPFTIDERVKVQRFIQRAITDGRKVIIHARDVKLGWWAPWFREFVAKRFIKIIVDG